MVKDLDKMKLILDQLEIIPEDKTQIDFSNICSISTSFAHQFITRKNRSHKTITEINMSENVEKMFRIIDSEITNKSKLLDIESMQVVTTYSNSRISLKVLY
jgi:hypothetical protein